MDENSTNEEDLTLASTVRTLLRTDEVLSPNNNEALLLKKLQGLVNSIHWSPTEAGDLFSALLRRFESTSTNDKGTLHSWLLRMLHSVEINYVAPRWKCQTGKTVMELIRDETVTDESLRRCLAESRGKKLDEILDEIREQKSNPVDEKLFDEVKDILSTVEVRDGSQQNGLKKDLSALCRAVEKSKGYKPRLTQMVSWCLMALSQSGWLIQVGTGEGKSCIVAMFAAFRALRGEKVDIMSSSSVLAERDFTEWREFYKKLKISVSCNVNKQSEDLKKCYECHVVYGAAEEFAGDWLRHHVQRKDIRGQRPFQCAIVDEVDSLMLDKGLHVVYLGSDTPALQYLNPLLALIWATANQYEDISTEYKGGKQYPFYQVVLESITADKNIDEFTILQMAEDMGALAKGSVQAIRKKPGLLPEKTASVTVKQMVTFFKTIEKRFPSCCFSLHAINPDGEVEAQEDNSPTDGGERQSVSLLLLDGGVCRYLYSDEESVQRAAEAEIKRAVHFTPCGLSQDKNKCYVPGFLADLFKSKLNVWIENAFLAKTMSSDHEYVLEMHGVVPVDYSCTGVVENGTTWTDGLQQFIEMKHGSKLSDVTAITNYMSNVGLLQKYGNQIYGVSGTLGQQAEIETLQKLYDGIRTCQIPSFKRRKLFEVEGVVVDEEEEWVGKICDVVTAQINKTSFRDERAVLVICETISRAKRLHRALGDRVPNKNFYINNNVDNTAIVTKELGPGDVIIATNLAGRGTDLKVSSAVNEAGGLFVVQTFLPKNARVEAQAFGRTARQGTPGCAQLIVCTSHLLAPIQLLVLTQKIASLFEKLIDAKPLFRDLFLMLFRLYQQGHTGQNSMPLTLSHILKKKSKSAINRAKNVRDEIVAKTLARYLEHDIPKVKKKEEIFSQYLKILDDVYEQACNEPAELDVSILNETWGMWLLMSFNEQDSTEDLKTRLASDLHRARQKVTERESPVSNPQHYVAFGNELRQRGQLGDSIKMYTKAIEKDPCWAAIAYYNRAFALLSLQEKQQYRNNLNPALEDLQNALKSVDLYCDQIEVMTTYFKQSNPGIESTTRFEKHMEAKYHALELLRKNINEAISKVKMARSLGRDVKVNEELVYLLAPSELIIPLVLISLRTPTLIPSSNPLTVQQLLSHQVLYGFLELQCLNSLGLTRIYTLETLFSVSGLFSKLFL